MKPLFALVDCNNFYVSCERLFRPDLGKKPVVVLSNNDGCIISRSDEAKALGIKMGAPLFLVHDLLKKEGVHIFSSNYELYGDLSFRVTETLRQFTPQIEIYSIDESFLDLTKYFFLNLKIYAENLRNTVRKNTGIPVSVGISYTKTLAKIANRLAKKSEKAGGVLVLTDERHIDAALKRTAIEDVWGVGRQYAKFFRASGIYTAHDLKNAQDAWIQKHGTVVMRRTVQELRGISCLDIELMQPDKKGICTSRSFGKSVTNLGALQEAIAIYASSCAKKLRKQKSCAKVLKVFVKTNKYADTLQYFNSKEIILPTASNSDLELVKYATKALNEIYKEGYLYKKAGVIVTELMPESNVQLNLLDTTDHLKHNNLMAAIDEITRKLGKNAVTIAQQGTKESKDWHPIKEYVSPCYTTRLKDILTIHI
ncbi:MAG: SOS mutagenesis and repair protein UmuC [Cytophagales bacterium CG18_big_fil_WC_8_21_14_2_50_42_9]|nr:MAG: SOS mutagenesis and repair protein UmuC [Cytophagales bacterium CG18_big_fil_WC_8_21_14_2_50_42_9]